MGYVVFYAFMLVVAVVVLGGYSAYKKCKVAYKKCQAVYMEEFGE